MDESGPALERANVNTLKGVGPQLAAKLEKLGIRTLADVLFHLPLRYEDRTRITPIGHARIGEQVVLEGEVISCEVAFGRRRSLLAYLKDATGVIALRFYHFSKAQQTNLQGAKHITCFGEVRRGAAGLELYHPEYTMGGGPVDEYLTPVYPATEGVTQQRYRKLVGQVLDMMAHGLVLQDFLGGIVRAPQLAYGLNDAVKLMHRPPPDADIDKLLEGTHAAQARLAFEELLAHHTSMRLVREEIAGLISWPMQAPGDAYSELRDNLGFELTRAQRKAGAEIAADMMKTAPMVRLLQGDVGSGKTVVATLAAVHAVENGLQTVIMAPTEILAEQHYINISYWLSARNISTAWLSGKVKGKRRDEELALIASGTANVIVGTHALFQKDVEFKRLGLVIIDEQHRFGVHQRLALREKGEADGKLPHQLVMTATPIPRTLTMSLYADMDCSIIDELPPGRSPVTTSVLPDNRRDDVIARVEAACTSGAQAYWVCTLIEESEVLQCQAAEATAEQLKVALPDLRIALVHGRMTPAEKTLVMNRFKAGDVDLLVATTVIEVGVDVANASLMIIENAERLGLAQLHQLRGRIGRGKAQSHCVLMYHPPLGETGKLRLNVLRETTDGFRIAEEDLRIRGPGEVLGSRQSGSLAFRVADIVRDADMLTDVRRAADELLANNREEARAIMDRWIVMGEKLVQV